LKNSLKPSLTSTLSHINGQRESHINIIALVPHIVHSPAIVASRVNFLGQIQNSTPVARHLSRHTPIAVKMHRVQMTQVVENPAINEHNLVLTQSDVLDLRVGVQQIPLEHLDFVLPDAQHAQFRERLEVFFVNFLQTRCPDGEKFEVGEELVDAAREECELLVVNAVADNIGVAVIWQVVASDGLDFFVWFYDEIR
jgi:hypothetical protein